jgi:His-Xaa-Ser system protein HxsD
MSRLDGVSIERRKNAASFLIDTRTYALDAVMAAAYAFTSRAWVWLEQPSLDTVCVDLTAKQRLGKAALETFTDVFCNELLAQVLRERNARRYGKLGEMLVGKALFASAAVPEEAPAAPAETPVVTAPPSTDAAVNEPSLADLPGADTDYLADPYGIAVPWEEKYKPKGKARKKPGDR